MKTNKIMDSIRKTTPENTNKQVDLKGTKRSVYK